MTLIEIENHLHSLIANFDKKTFIFDLLLAYGMPKATIKRLQGSDHDKLASNGTLMLRKKLYFKVASNDLHAMIENLKTAKEVTKHAPRFIIVTDYETLLAYDTKTDDTLDTELPGITNHYDFFLPLAGMEKATFTDENPADVKASIKMAKLYDELQKNNAFKTKEEIHALNVFLTRLLFCYFAEDTNIFTDNLFTSSISSHTQADGSDIADYLARLFTVFNTPHANRAPNTPAYLNAFPYVNGGLFADAYDMPRFTARSRSLLLEVGQLQWSQINPDIFGSMIQAVVTPEHRGGMGMHYTSVPNIMKVIEPLFLDELYGEFEKAYESKPKLQALLKRLTKIKIFDPACGSGNFLIIAYKKLRELEMNIMKRIDSFLTQKSIAYSEIKLTQFYGIELDDFAHEVAMLSLWLAEHQMNLEFYKAFGRTSPSLPLHEGGHIVHANATRIEWEEVCPKEDGDEIYVLGNPPYQGSGKQNAEQKADMDFVFSDVSSYKKLDYIACWFYKGAKYMQNSNTKLSFVTTNSITQGEQVGILWPYIFEMSLEIGFAYQSFKWKNNAKDNAGVSVVIIGLRNILNERKFIYQENIKQEVKNINAYLVQGSNTFISPTYNNISKLPKMIKGSSPSDNGFLLCSENKKNEIISKYPEAEKFIKKYIGNQDFMSGNKRYCIWVTEKEKAEAYKIEALKERFEKVRQFRLASSKAATRKKAETPHLFDEAKHQNLDSIIVPQTGSEKREYLPIGFMDKDTVISNGLRIVYTQEVYIFGILSSKMHIVWVKAVAGRMKTDMQYSNTICYNTFPFPNISQKQKDAITELVWGVLDEREKHSQKTLAQLYDPNKMPEGLKKAHHNLDKAIEQCYRPKPFESDEERLEYLFRMYEEMMSKEKKK